MGVKIIIDSSSDYEPAQAKKEGLVFLPLTISFPDRDYMDGTELSHERFYELLESNSSIPSTSQINPSTFEEAFYTAVKQGDKVVAITLSSRISGTYSSAKIAARSFPGNVYVVDSKNVTAGLHLLIKYAVKLRDEGKTAEEIVSQLERKKHLVHTIGVLDTLKYLHKGGRISSATALTGTLLNIKPYAKVDEEGMISIAGKARGTKAALKAVAEMLKEMKVDTSLPVIFAYAARGEETMKKLKDICSSAIADAQILPDITIGSTVGTHVGHGAVALGFFSL